MSAPKTPDGETGFPTFESQENAEAYSDRTRDAYFELCYHLEGKLNVCLKVIHDLYAGAPSAIRPKMQTGVVRKIICPDGWPEHGKTVICMLVACARFSHEQTCHAGTVKEAMAALLLEKEQFGLGRDAAFHAKTLEPLSSADAANARADLLRLCDWIESRFHFGTHLTWYQAPDCFSDDPEKAHLANIGIAQRHLAKFSERDRKRWEGMHQRAAEKHQADMKAWSIVGKVQHDPEDPRTWTHPEVDARIIGLWPLVLRYNWTYPDFLKVLDMLLPLPDASSERRYPLDSTESLKVHCRTICGLTKPGKGRSAKGLPDGAKIAERLFPNIAK